MLKKQEEMQAELTQLTNKYELAVKEKMLMKLEKDRLIAKVENLEISMNQLSEEQSIDKNLSKAEASVTLGQSSAKPATQQA